MSQESIEPAASETYQRFGPQCQTHITPRIRESRDANYHGADVSPVDCPTCGTQLGPVTL